MEITKDQFLAYEKVRQSGKYNMVMEAAGAKQYAELTWDEYWEIIKDYSELKKKFGEENGDN